MTFEGFVREVGGLSRQYAGANWVVGAAAKRWRDLSEPARSW